ncbi:MAG: phosphoribosyl-AMP cyclohydrolase [Cellvibrionaceae bacterium]
MDNHFFKQLEPLSQGSQVDLQSALQHLRFDENGLIPAIAQQQSSGEVLMMAWMNKDSLQETLETRQVCYWSRSRQALWRKGESSGNIQTLVELRIDCDGDTLLCVVDQKGPACHTDRTNCFYLRADDKDLSVIANPVTSSETSS